MYRLLLQTSPSCPETTRRRLWMVEKYPAKRVKRSRRVSTLSPAAVSLAFSLNGERLRWRLRGPRGPSTRSSTRTRTRWSSSANGVTIRRLPTRRRRPRTRGSPCRRLRKPFLMTKSRTTIRTSSPWSQMTLPPRKFPPRPLPPRTNSPRFTRTEAVLVTALQAP
ncbi:hypothetical protein LX32DRAFT_89106 [Colletotrichum zoysiae]|uniref:Uncharacterized protein n=1 Tax=Colletotrichum zoysiae TaxID=1216348 RepID=A0AAD9M8F7_9PEZI|nr:hypothetical protein LX32DRAFT_89106 [Colletotrichum zoysiae]